MTTPTRYQHSGNAVETTITAGINSTDTTITIASATGWPDGSVANFFVQLTNSDGSASETVKIASRTSTTLTVAGSGRGADSTTAASWSSGSIIRHVVTATEIDALNSWAANPGGTGDIADIGTAEAAGSTGKPADAGHVHVIGSGAINSSGMFAAGVVDAAAIATDAVGTAEIAADAVTSSEIAADAVGTSEIAANAVTSSELADDAVDTAAIANLAVTTGKIAADAINGTKIADDSIDSEHYVDGSIDTAHLADDSVTAAKLASPILQAYCEVSRITSNVTLADNTVTDIPFNSETYDTHGWHDTVTNPERVTPNIAGLYLVNSYLDFNSKNYEQIGAYIYKNTTVIGATVTPHHTGATSKSPGLMISTLVVLNGTTDYVKVAGYQDNGTPSSQAIVTGSYLQVFLLSPLVV